MKNKYTAIKVKGINHWFWFECEKFETVNHEITGKAGWGKGGAYTDLTISTNLVEGQIFSDALQYTN